MPDINAILQQIVAQQQQPQPAPAANNVSLSKPQGKPNSALTAAAYGAQLADGLTSAALFKRPRTYERNPLVRPFTHGGMSTMLPAGAAEDAIVSALAKGGHWSAGTQNNAHVLQLLAHILGMLVTSATMKHYGR